MEEFGTADRTVAVAMRRLRDEGLVYVVPGGGWYVRPERGIVRAGRRLSRSEREAGRGTFETDLHAAGLRPDRSRTTYVSIEPCSDVVAGELGIEVGEDVVTRERTMATEGGPVLQLATSYLPASLIADAPAIAEQNTGPGGIYTRLEEAGHQLSEFEEVVQVGRATEHEARQMGLTPGDPVFRVVRTAWSGDHAVEVNHMVITSDRYALVYRVPAN